MWWQVCLCNLSWWGDLLKLQHLLDRCQGVKQSTIPAIWHCLLWLQARWSCQYLSKGPLTITGCSWDTPKTPFANNHKPPRVWDTVPTLLKGSRKVVFQRRLTPKRFNPDILGYRSFELNFWAAQPYPFSLYLLAPARQGWNFYFSSVSFSVISLNVRPLCVKGFLCIWWQCL